MNWYKKTLTSDSQSDIISPMKKEFIIMRGASGSGKSFLAKQLAGENGQIFSADDYFMDYQGNYNWEGSEISTAHKWNHNRIKEAIENGISPVVMDNTNITMWDMAQSKPIIQHAMERGYDVRIEETQTPWAFDPKELAKRNTHGLDEKRIEKQISRWAPDVTVDDVLNYEK
jgi:predicted kinase